MPIPILEGAGNVPIHSFVTWNDSQGNLLISINRDGTISVVGVRFQSDVGTNAPIQLTGAIPIIATSDDFTNTNLPQSITHNAGPNTMHQIALAAISRGNGAAGAVLNFTLQYTTPAGSVTTLTNAGFILGPGNGSLRGNIVDTASCTFNIVALVGAPIILSTSFSSTSFNYDLSLRIIEVPAAVTL